MAQQSCTFLINVLILLKKKLRNIPNSELHAVSTRHKHAVNLASKTSAMPKWNQTSKRNIVPTHAMKAQREREGTCALYRSEWSASCPRTNLNILRSTKSLFICRNSNSRLSGLWPSHYTDYNILAPVIQVPPQN